MFNRGLSRFDPEDLLLLHKLSRLSSLPESAQDTGAVSFGHIMSLQEAVAFYDVLSNALYKPKDLDSTSDYEDSTDEPDELNSKSLTVMEVFQAQRYNTYTAKERMLKKQEKKKNNVT